MNRYYFILILMLFPAMLEGQTAGLSINEFLAINENCRADEFGEFDDWLEIFNISDQAVNLGGMYVTDDLADPAKWQIPAANPDLTTIEPGGFLVLWFDGQPDQGVLHVEPKLNGGGEEIGLFAAAGLTPIDTLTFGPQQADISFGRTLDGLNNWSFFDKPTPGQSNNQFELKEYYITCDPDSFAYIYQNYGEDHYIRVTFSQAGQTWPNVRLRIRGDSSRSYPKKSLKFKFDDQPFSNGRNTLNFNAEYLDKSYLHAIISSVLMRISGQPCFGAEPARLFLNGQFLGLYIRVENMDRDFLTARDLDENGNLYKAAIDGACLSIYDDPDYHWQKKTNENSGSSDLQNLITDINSVSESNYYDFARAAFDYDKMINIIAMNMLIANGSTYYHNYYL